MSAIGKAARVFALLLVGSLVAIASAQEAKSIVFGGAIPLTGWASDTGQLNLRGYELWAEQVNAAGGILGRQVELKIYDDQSDPTTTARLYERLITQDGVDVLLAPWSDDMTMPATTVAERYGKPIVTGGATLPDIWERGYKYVTGLLPSSYDYVGVPVRLLEGKVSTAAIASLGLTFTTGFGDAAETVLDELGIKLVARETYGTDTQNFTPITTKFRVQNPDLLIAAAGGVSDAVQLVQTAKLSGLNPQMIYITIAPVEPDFIQILGADAEYILGTTEWEPTLVHLPGFDAFHDAYVAKYGEEPVEDVATSYGLAQVLQQAIETAGELDDDKINEALHTMDTATVFGEYRVDPDTGRQLGKGIYAIQIQDGRREIVWPPEYATSELRFPAPAWNDR